VESREDSLERLLENGKRFVDTSLGVDDLVIYKIMVDKLNMAIELLSPSEKELIVKHYFMGMTERQIAEEIGVFHNAIHKRKKRILAKLKKIINEI